MAALPAGEKGLVLGALCARMAPEAAATRFGGATGARCAAALAAIATETRSGRAAAQAALIALARAPVPAGVERVHGGWLRERLEAESSTIIAAIVAGLPVEVVQAAAEVLGRRGETLAGQGSPRLEPSPAGLAELRRRVFGGLTPLAGPAAPAAPAVKALLELSFAALEEAIERRGAETLGASLRGAPGPVVARAAAGVGGRLGQAVLEAAAQAGESKDREVARSLVAGATAERSAQRLYEVGLAALARQLAGEGPDACLAVAQRLPPDRGRRLLALCARVEG